jgi:DNA-binding MarR family transcriptional regulator
MDRRQSASDTACESDDPVRGIDPLSEPGPATQLGPGRAAHDAYVEDEDLLIAWLNLARVSATMRLELDRAMERENGIGLTEGEVLTRLIFAPDGRLRMSDLADQLCMAQSGITRVVDRLVRQGFVVRETRPSNRRTVDARLTQAGREVHERARPVYIQLVRNRFGRGMNVREAARLRALLRSVLEGLGACEEVPWADRVQRGKNITGT